MNAATRAVRIVRLDESLAAEVARLWRHGFPCREVNANVAWNPYGGPMTSRSVRSRILGQEGFDPAGSFVALDGRRVVGFGLAVMGAGATGHLCGLVVAPSARRRGVGSLLLRRIEAFLRRRGAREIVITFEGNPVPLLVGVPTNPEAAPFLLNRRFRNYEGKFLQVMTQDTTRYRFPKAIRERTRRLAADGIRIERVEAAQRNPVDGFLRRHFPEWHDGIMNGVLQDPPAPLLVAVRSRTVLGFAGTYGVASSGAGHFHALGVAPAARRQGIGAALFHTMCAEMKAAGARAVNLTTGLGNPAQELYAAAGFRARCLVHWGMQKDLAPSNRGRKKRPRP